jgi:hypothetical protein
MAQGRRVRGRVGGLRQTDRLYCISGLVIPGRRPSLVNEQGCSLAAISAPFADLPARPYRPGDCPSGTNNSATIRQPAGSRLHLARYVPPTSLCLHCPVQFPVSAAVDPFTAIETGRRTYATKSGSAKVAANARAMAAAPSKRLPSLAMIFARSWRMATAGPTSCPAIAAFDRSRSCLIAISSMPSFCIGSELSMLSGAWISPPSLASLRLRRTRFVFFSRGCATRSPKGEAWPASRSSRSPARLRQRLRRGSPCSHASEGWWAWQDSNLQPDRYERPALTIELQAPQQSCGAAPVYRASGVPAMVAERPLALGWLTSCSLVKQPAPSRSVAINRRHADR